MIKSTFSPMTTSFMLTFAFYMAVYTIRVSASLLLAIRKCLTPQTSLLTLILALIYFCHLIEIILVKQLYPSSLLSISWYF